MTTNGSVCPNGTLQLCEDSLGALFQRLHERAATMVLWRARRRSIPKFARCKIVPGRLRAFERALFLRPTNSVTEPAQCVQRSLASLREVSAILDANAPSDAAAFKAWLRGISQKVAEAAVEGGFLGFGGVKVSDAEKATLDDIAKALGTTA